VRHLANVFQGLLMSSPDVINTPAKWAKLWLHESERVYADRLVSQAVRWGWAGLVGWLVGWLVGCQGVVILWGTAALSTPAATHNTQDLDNYNKSAVVIAKKYLALPGGFCCPRADPTAACI